MQPTKLVVWSALALFCSAGGQAQAAEKPAPAMQLLSAAKTRAGKEHKAVLVMFHSSWCGWCEQLADVMNRAPHKKLISDNYVLVSLDVKEDGAKKALENPGGEQLMNDLGGARAGLPFYAFLDARGKNLGTSVVPIGANKTPANIGCPATRDEIAAFDKLLQKTAPKMKVAGRKNLLATFAQMAQQRAH